MTRKIGTLLPRGIDAVTYGNVCMIAWEYVLEQTRDETNAWTRYRETHGVAETRDRCQDLVPALEYAWRIAARNGYDTCFDWEFCPEFFARCVDDDLYLRPDWRTTARTIAREYNTQRGG